MEAEFSSSDDDLYDDFEKYKRNRKINLPNISVSGLNLCKQPLPSTSNASNNYCTKECFDDFDIRDNDDAPIASKKRSDESIDFEAEFAGIPDEYPKYDRKTAIAKEKELTKQIKLRTILKEAQSAFDSLKDTKNESIIEEIPSVPVADEIVFKKRCTLNLRNVKNGQSFILRCDLDKPFDELIATCSERMNLDAKKVVLMGRDRRYYPTDQPLTVGLDENNIHDVDVYEDEPLEKIPIKWLLKGRKPITLNVPMSRPFSQLKLIFCAEQNLDPERTFLVFDSERLSEKETPLSLELEEGDCIDVYVN